MCASVPYDVGEKQQRLEDLFMADPLGLKTIPVNDVDCWTTRRGATSAGAKITVSSSETEAEAASALAPAAAEAPDATAEESKATQAPSGKGGSQLTQRQIKRRKQKKKKREKKRKKKQKQAVAKAAEAEATAEDASLIDDNDEDDADSEDSDEPDESISSTRVLVKTPFYNTLCILQKEHYKYMRKSIFRWLDKPAQELLTLLIDKCILWGQRALS